MDLPLRKAYGMELSNRTLYQQQLFEQQKNIANSNVSLQPFHPLQQQTFQFTGTETQKPLHSIPIPDFDMDIIDDPISVSPSEPHQFQPPQFQQHQPQFQQQPPQFQPPQFQQHQPQFQQQLPQFQQQPPQFQPPQFQPPQFQQHQPQFQQQPHQFQQQPPQFQQQPHQFQQQPPQFQQQPPQFQQSQQHQPQQPQFQQSQQHQPQQPQFQQSQQPQFQQSQQHQPQQPQFQQHQPQLQQPQLQQPQLQQPQLQQHQPQQPQPKQHQLQQHQLQQHQLQQHQPQFQQPQSQPPQFQQHQPQEQFAQQYHSAKPSDMKALQPPHQQQKPIQHMYQTISSHRPQSQPLRPHFSPLTQTVVAPINQEHQLIYKAFEIYFNNPTFTKTNDTSDSYSLYYARVTCMLAEFRYLIVVTDQDQAPMGTNVSLSDLQWKSFQLRTLSKEVKAPEITYKKENNGVFDDDIQLLKRDKTENKVLYQCVHNPLIVELLPTKKGSVHDYPEKATLEAAMDTFQCVIYFT
jgi:hypothetical protein